MVGWWLIIVVGDLVQDILGWGQDDNQVTSCVFKSVVKGLGMVSVFTNGLLVL